MATRDYCLGGFPLPSSVQGQRVGHVGTAVGVKQMTGVIRVLGRNFYRLRLSENPKKWNYNSLWC
jgi:hypothetical protein